MKIDNLNIKIISSDNIFIKLMVVILNHYIKNPKIEILKSFEEIKNTDIEKASDLILLDDIVYGVTSLEVISFLRLKQKRMTRLCFFSEDVNEIEDNALKRGANNFYKKPFNPKIILKEILDKISKE